MQDLGSIPNIGTLFPTPLRLLEFVARAWSWFLVNNFRARYLLGVITRVRDTLCIGSTRSTISTISTIPEFSSPALGPTSRLRCRPRRPPARSSRRAARPATRWRRRRAYLYILNLVELTISTLYSNQPASLAVTRRQVGAHQQVSGHALGDSGIHCLRLHA